MILKNKVYIVTGGTSGIGYAIGLNILKNGGKVILIGRNEKRVDNINKKHIKNKCLIAVKCDVSIEVEIMVIIFVDVDLSLL